MTRDCIPSAGLRALTHTQALWGPQAEAAKLDAATCPRQVERGRQVNVNLKELGYGG